MDRSVRNPHFFPQPDLVALANLSDGENLWGFRLNWMKKGPENSGPFISFAPIYFEPAEWL
jgi:hypothetical protein